jgi:hypothetical protein
MAGALLAAPAAAQVSLPGAAYERQVVLELFTAQGCSACPPADSMLAQLAMREDVIALALHVDYWDYIGWADTFALPEHTERQKHYARRNGHSTIYTPQVIVNGADVIEGFRVMQVMNAIDRHRAGPAQIRLELNRASNGALEIRARRNEGAEEAPAVVSRSAHGSEDGAFASTDPRIRLRRADGAEARPLHAQRDRRDRRGRECRTPGRLPQHRHQLAGHRHLGHALAARDVGADRGQRPAGRHHPGARAGRDRGGGATALSRAQPSAGAAFFQRRCIHSH